ncbi:MAG: MOSC domain-containing protein [Candidatus Nanopelagicales bacterium]
MHLSGLFVYPIKSCAGMPVDRWELGAMGLSGDRSYMVVDDEGVYLTQREEPRLALVRPVPGEPLTVATPAGSATPIPGARVEVSVWDYDCAALDCGDEVAGLLSDHLGRACRLVTLSPDHDRPSDHAGGRVGFADGYPLLITSESSLAELNARLPAPLPMNRFRPNLVVAGSPAFDEDHWRALEVGPIPVDVVKPCARCAITRVDQATGVRGDGEPLRTLGTFRKAKGGVMFGQNAVHRQNGVLTVGDAVRVVQPREPDAGATGRGPAAGN